MSLRRAADELGVERRYLKGYAECLGIDLLLIPPRYLMMTRRDLERLRKHLASRGVPEESAAG